MAQSVVKNAYAKINLALDIAGKRADGYHFVRMVMETIDLYDSVRVALTTDGQIALSCDAASVPHGHENLAVRAARAMQEHFGLLEGFQIHIEKRIPVAAGLAGGSADAAAVLNAINELCAVHASMEELSALALKLGADVPYCLRGGSYLAEGIGEALTPLPAPPNARILIAKPNAGLPTGKVYDAYDALADKQTVDVDQVITALYEHSLPLLAGACANVLQEASIRLCPAIDSLISLMLSYGALSAVMSGSGPTVFGLFPVDTDDCEKAFHAIKKKNLAPDLAECRFHNEENV